MRPTLAPQALGRVLDSTERELSTLAPELVAGFRRAAPRAAAVIGRRLRGALHREGLPGGEAPPADRDAERHADRVASGRADRVASGRGGRVAGRGGGRRHGFGRIEFDSAPEDPVELLAGIRPPVATADTVTELAAEVTNAAVNLALAYARRAGLDQAVRENAAPWTGVAGPIGTVAYSRFMPPDERLLFLERLATEGHNLHPCGRTRLGWRPADVLGHDLETDGTQVGFVAIRRDRHVGDDLGELLRAGYPGHVPPAPDGYLVQPVHAWQLDRIAGRHDPDVVRPLAGPPLPAWPTAALRTLLLPPGEDEAHRYLKLSLDIQVTSTRRTISIASARNGPTISALLHRLTADEERLLLLAETAGAGLDGGPDRDRDATAILRTGLTGRLGPDEVAVPAVALPARCPLTGQPVLTELVDAYGRARGHTDRSGAASGFLDEYAALLLPPVLRLATRFGVGLEVHLQNCVPTFRHGMPHRLLLRDFAGLRLHLPRLCAQTTAPVPELWPNSVVATDDAGVLRAKVAYTAFQAHLGELVVTLTGTHGLDEDAAWRRVRALVDEVYGPLRADPAVGEAARADHAFLTAPTVPHKALVRMRLAPRGGDRYVPVPNPLHRPGHG